MPRSTMQIQPRPKVLNAVCGDSVWYAKDLLLYGEMELMRIENKRMRCKLNPGTYFVSYEEFYPGELLARDDL